MHVTTSRILLVCALAWASAPQQTAVQEHWVNPGVMVSPTTDLPRFVQTVDGAFVGVLEQVSMVFLDESDANTLHTVLTFRVKEWLFGGWPGAAAKPVQVLSHGGWYVEEHGKLVPKRLSETAEQMTIGGEYFVPIQFGGRFGREGKLLVGSSVAMSRLDGDTVTPVMRHVTWSHEVIAQARAGSPATGQSAREVFLTALRTAGLKK